MTFARKTLPAILSIAIAATATGAAAKTMVVKASGGAESRYKPGAMLTPGTALKLKPGERMTLFHDGRSIVLAGPSSGTVATLAARPSNPSNGNRPAVRSARQAAPATAPVEEEIRLAKPSPWRGENEPRPADRPEPKR